MAAIFLVCLSGGNSSLHARTTAETNRLSLLRGLIEQRAELARAGNTTGLRRCDARIRGHPAPPDSDAATLARCLVGAWRSPRHDYLYRSDGSWTLLPAERGGLHGHWRIAGNQLQITSGYAGPRSTEDYTIIMIGDEDFVFADRETVFFEKRLPPPRNRRKHSTAVSR